MTASAIIVAAGSGTRLGFDVPKAFVELGGRSLLSYSLRTIAAVAAIEEAVIALPAGMESRARADIKAVGLEIPVKLTQGGAERQDSVRIALELTSAEAELVVVHDAARPFATPTMFEAALAAAARTGGAIVATPLADTLKRIDLDDADDEDDGAGDRARAHVVANTGDVAHARFIVATGDRKHAGMIARTGDRARARIIVATVARAGLWQAQTPQAFRRALLIRAHQRAVQEGIAATDDAHLVELLGAKVEVVEGSALNFKITTVADLHLAELAVTSHLKP
jgi:2-C-methyl-D-erythritol 4-phosphate cytidylyltransferase